MIAAATAAFNDSDPESSAGYGGIYNLSDTSSAIASEMPSDSFPITIMDGLSIPVSRGRE